MTSLISVKYTQDGNSVTLKSTNLSSILSVILFAVLLSLKRKSQVDYRDMIFFDDERWNISDITTLGNDIGIF